MKVISHFRHDRLKNESFLTKIQKIHLFFFQIHGPHLLMNTYVISQTIKSVIKKLWGQYQPSTFIQVKTHTKYTQVKEKNTNI